jgi:hypothetical protein
MAGLLKLIATGAVVMATVVAVALDLILGLSGGIRFQGGGLDWVARFTETTNYYGVAFDGIQGHMEATNGWWEVHHSTLAVEFWIFSDGDNSVDQPLLSAMIPGEGSGWGVFISDSGTKLEFRVVDEYLTVGSLATNSMSLFNSTWHHVLAQYQTNGMTLWLDGAFAGSATYPNSATNSETLLVNRNDEVACIIREIRISNALIKTNSFTPTWVLGTNAATIGYWPMTTTNQAAALDATSTSDLIFVWSPNWVVVTPP